jgi:hypothetical protein
MIADFCIPALHRKKLLLSVGSVSTVNKKLPLITTLWGTLKLSVSEVLVNLPCCLINFFVNIGDLDNPALGN